jgi:hypothetical protein
VDKSLPAYPRKHTQNHFFSNEGSLIDPLSYRMGELSGWFYQLSTGGINKMRWFSKNQDAEVISFSCPN